MKFALLSFCFNIMFFCQGQQLWDNKSYADGEIGVTNRSPPDERIFDWRVETEAEYPGGINALRKYVAEQADNIGLYPKEAQEEKKEGRMIIRFVVEKDGSVSNFKVQRDDVGYGAAEKLIDILKNAEKWKPAKTDGKPVRSVYRFVIVFKLPPEDSTEQSAEE